MSLAHLQCFCGQQIGLSSPANSFSRASTLPQEFIAKCPCGLNWRITLARRNPAYAPSREIGDPTHESPA